MSKKLIVKIRSNGEIEASTKNIKGKKCLDYINVFKEILNAEVTDSSFTDEYYENDNINNNEIIGEDVLKNVNN
ncbi:DUF2997 domain-containing protein [uncultured Anaerofustis sp.]|uniref:DUF2997 domain-containing protein n=1 Tax=uncultured Anaerofustis sp. TaxID=904996 RepID=UPI0025EA1A24|nr:DUF2997 domain-containing protein [uncultured Anaerofustis sp.]